MFLRLPGCQSRQACKRPESLQPAAAPGGPLQEAQAEQALPRKLPAAAHVVPHLRSADEVGGGPEGALRRKAAPVRAAAARYMQGEALLCGPQLAWLALPAVYGETAGCRAGSAGVSAQSTSSLASCRGRAWGAGKCAAEARAAGHTSRQAAHAPSDHANIEEDTCSCNHAVVHQGCNEREEEAREPYVGQLIRACIAAIRCSGVCGCAVTAD